MNKYILCPVCEKHKFIKFEKDEDYVCPNCGWKYDPQAEENPFEIYKADDLCLNDYKLRYEYYVEQNPNYRYSRDKYPKLPQVKPMLCPVCKKYHFEELTIEDIYLGVTPLDVQCQICGWHYDINQLNDENKKYSANEMSLNEYKAWYEKKLIENENYNYFEECINNYTPLPHTCPVCGKYSFSDVSSHEICPFCGWEDDELMEEEADKWEGCSNDLCLNDYIKRYRELVKIKKIINI